MDFSKERNAIAQAAGKFPSEFGMRQLPGCRFRIEQDFSFVSEMNGLQLSISIHRQDEKWEPYCKATTKELTAEVVPLTQ